MAATADELIGNLEGCDAPVEMLVVGCPLATADGFANTLRNQGQAAHLKLAETRASLEQQLESEECSLVIINADAKNPACIDAVEQVRQHDTTTSIILVAKNPSTYRKMAIEHGLQDLIRIDDEEHLALAVRREYRTRLLHDEIRRLRRQLDEAQGRSDQLVDSSRDAIAYVHEGIYLKTNQAYRDMFAFDSADEIDGLPIMDTIDAESRGAFKSALRKVGESGKRAAEFRCITGDGQGFDARIEFSPAQIDGDHCTQITIRDRSQNLALQQRIDELTSKDTQTGLFNRQAFMERLEALVAGNAKLKKGLSLMQLSISNCGDIRDSCGFGCVEHMLTEIANVLAATASGAHTLARFGDHDFMVLCDGEEPALEIAERSLHNLRGHAFKSIQDSPIQALYSVGITRVPKQGGVSAHELINRTCRATDIARAEGENRVVFYNEQIPGDTGHMDEADAAIVKEIDAALANDGFRLKYQPLVSLQGDTRENYSVYVRMTGKNGAETVPEVFLSPARDAKRLAEIDRWVVRNAIRELSNHRKDGKKIIFYIILSRAGIEDDSMLLWICDCLREFRVKGAWLCFQFRESDLRASLKPAKQLVEGLRKVNCRIAIANYHHPHEGEDPLLKHLPVDVIKLSPELTRELATDAAQQDRLNQINGQLQESGYKTIASNVEDAGSLAILWNVGVNYIQGYFLQEPSSTILYEEQSTDA